MRVFQWLASTRNQGLSSDISLDIHPPSIFLKKIKLPGGDEWSFLSRQIYLISRSKLHTSYDIRNAGMRLRPMHFPHDSAWIHWSFMSAGSFAFALRIQVQMPLGEVTQEAVAVFHILW